MKISLVTVQNKKEFSACALHPMQSWEWGDFRNKTGVLVIRLGRFDGEKLIETAQITIHPIPFTSYSVGYFPKGGITTGTMMEKIREIGKEYKCIFIKFEPNIEIIKWRRIFKKEDFEFRVSPHPLFTKYTFQLDLKKTPDELLKKINTKTRYNIRLAQKKGVFVVEDNSSYAFNKYIQLTFETVKRQKFYAHNPKYHEMMWETLHPGMAHLMAAKYKIDGKLETLVTWILFIFNNKLYYPYGASSNIHRNVMASNLMAWEAILYGKKNNCHVFDMWGALGPNPTPSNPWYGFHRFKESYGATLVELAGSFDLVINPLLYRIYNTAHIARNIFLWAKKR